MKLRLLAIDFAGFSPGTGGTRRFCSRGGDPAPGARDLARSEPRIADANPQRSTTHCMARCGWLRAEKLLRWLA
eukprot:1369728-Rhodomonas_salina.2